MFKQMNNMFVMLFQSSLQAHRLYFLPLMVTTLYTISSLMYYFASSKLNNFSHFFFIIFHDKFFLLDDKIIINLFIYLFVVITDDKIVYVFIFRPDYNYHTLL
jgi:hypothetical protein